MRLGVLASHEGTTLQAVLDAIAEGRLAATVAAVISNNRGSGALRRARAAGAPALHLSSVTHPDPDELDRAILAALSSREVDLVFLAGYMKKLGRHVLAEFGGRIWNTHPALLPKYGGQGMYGSRVHAAVLAAGDAESGASIHLVDAEYDAGRVIAQCRVPVRAGDSVDDLAARVQECERELVVRTLAARASGALDHGRDQAPNARRRATMGSEHYVIQGGVAGRERLRLLEEVMGAATRALLAEVGIPSGAACLDVGCGGGDVTVELARAVGAAGRVVGVDLDATKLAIARREAAQQGLENVEFLARDVVAWDAGDSFDVVYARFLLTHLSDPAALLAALRRRLRPGGVIVVEDIDFRGHFAEPDCRALARFVELYTASVRRRGGDPNIGPRLPGLLRAAGLADIKMKLYHPAALHGGIKLLTCVTLEGIAEAALADGLTTAEELRETIAELYAFARDPHTVLGGPRVVQAWGRSGTQEENQA